MNRLCKPIQIINNKACELCPYGIAPERVCAGVRCAAFEYVTECEHIDVLAADVATQYGDNGKLADMPGNLGLRKKQLADRTAWARENGWTEQKDGNQRLCGYALYWQRDLKTHGYCVRLEADARRLRSYGF